MRIFQKAVENMHACNVGRSFIKLFLRLSAISSKPIPILYFSAFLCAIST